MHTLAHEDADRAVPGDPPKPVGETLPVRVLGDFELRREIGRGGMGTVYEAWQRSLGRVVAIKVLRSHVGTSPVAVARFQREAQAAATLHHTNIVPIFAQGEQDGVYYYAMEYVAGRSLGAIIAAARDGAGCGAPPGSADETIALDRSAGPVDATAETVALDVAGASAPSTTAGGDAAGRHETEHDTPGPDVADRGAAEPGAADGHAPDRAAQDTSATAGLGREHFETVARHIASIADALDYAHDRGIIHRDIKPHNLILGDDGRMRVSDFGLARVAANPGVTVTGEFIGSPLYMSVEQVTGSPGDVDHRTDIYSLGATMFEWLTLRPPFPGETREQVINRIAHEEPTPPRACNPRIPVDLETICLKAMDRDCHRRYRTAGAMRDDLERFLSHRPIRAKRTNVVVRMGKFVHRHAAASVAATAAVLALLLAWALLVTKSESRTHRENVVAANKLRDEAELERDQLRAMVGRLPRVAALVAGAEAASPVIAELMASGQRMSADAGLLGVDGSPAGLARRAACEFFYEMAARPDVAAGAAGPGTAAPAGTSGAVDGRGDTGRAGMNPAARSLLDEAIRVCKSEPQRAAELADRCVAAAPDSFAAHELRAALCCQTGRYDDLAQDAAALVDLRPDAVGAFLWRGMASLLRGDGRACLEDFTRVTERTASQAWGYALRGFALAELARWDDAASEFDAALARSPDLVVALLGRAGAYAELARHADAVSDTSRVIALEPNNTVALAIRGTCYLRLGMNALAAKDFDRAIKIAPALIQLYPLYYRATQGRHALAPASPAAAPAAPAGPVEAKRGSRPDAMTVPKAPGFSGYRPRATRAGAWRG
ncbi:MAG: protein kinase [Phycisphaerae bacterium]